MTDIQCSTIVYTFDLSCGGKFDFPMWAYSKIWHVLPKLKEKRKFKYSYLLYFIIFCVSLEIVPNKYYIGIGWILLFILCPESKRPSDLKQKKRTIILTVRCFCFYFGFWIKEYWDLLLDIIGQCRRCSYQMPYHCFNTEKVC